MSEEQYCACIDRLPEPIRDIGTRNPLIYRICQEYATGHILTLEEALCQMVVHLDRDWDAQRRRAYELAMLQAVPIMVPKN